MFGRKKAEDEDPFAALKQGGTYQSKPATTVEGIPGSGLDNEPTVVPFAAPTPPAPASAPTPPAPPTLTGGSRQTRMRPMRPMRVNSFGVTRVSGPGRLIVWFIVLGVAAAIVIPVISTTSNAIHAISIPSFSFPTDTTGNSGNPLPVTPSTPKPAQATNYLTAAGARSGLRQIVKRFPGARVITLRLDSHSLDAVVFVPHGGVKNVDFAPSGTFISSSNSTGKKSIPVSAVPAGAVPRIVAAMSRRFHVPPNRIDYTVLTGIPNVPLEWITFSKAPSHPGFAANLNGSGLHRL